MILSAQLEVQSYYFLSPRTLHRPPNFALNALRAYGTSHDLIGTAVALESASQFLTHGAHWIYRSAVDAGCILLSTLHSTAAPRHISPADADALAARVRSVLQSCSVRECDLPARGSVILETFWSVRNLLPKSEEPVGAWPERIGAAVTYWCLNRFRDALQEAKRSTEGVSRGLEAFRKFDYHAAFQASSKDYMLTVTQIPTLQSRMKILTIQIRAVVRIITSTMLMIRFKVSTGPCW